MHCILLTFLYETSFDKMRISAKINCCYFTGLQYNSKRVVPNYMLKVRLPVNVQVLHSSLEGFYISEIGFPSVFRQVAPNLLNSLNRAIILHWWVGVEWPLYRVFHDFRA